MSAEVGTMGLAQRGAIAIARVIGRMAGAIARALGANRRRGGDGGRKPSERDRLLAEIAGLETELDQVYYLLARGDAGLGGLLFSARELKERLRKARARLRRLVRLSAMDLQLRRSLSSKPGQTVDESLDIGRIENLLERYDFEDEDGEFEFESLLDGDL
jgi:hypothetical protein